MTNPTPAEARAREALVRGALARAMNQVKGDAWRSLADAVGIAPYAGNGASMDDNSARMVDAILAAIASRVDAEWRARVEGAKRKIESEALIVVNDDPNHDGGTHECNYCTDLAAVGRSLAALDALLTAVARDREVGDGR